MAQHAGFSRLVYNYGLDLFWQSVDAGLKVTDSKRIQAIKKCLTNITKKRAEFAWMNQMSSKVYQSALQSLQTAFSRWRKGIAKAPNRKTKHSKQSFTVYDSNGSVLVRSGKSIKIPTLGTFRLQEPLEESYISQTFVTSSKNLSFCFGAGGRSNKRNFLYFKLLGNPFHHLFHVLPAIKYRNWILTASYLQLLLTIFSVKLNQANISATDNCQSFNTLRTGKISCPSLISGSWLG